MTGLQQCVLITNDAAQALEARYPSDQAYHSEKYQMGDQDTCPMPYTSPLQQWCPRREGHPLGLNNLVGYVNLDHSKPENQGKLLVITLPKASY